MTHDLFSPISAAVHFSLNTFHAWIVSNAGGSCFSVSIRVEHKHLRFNAGVQSPDYLLLLLITNGEVGWAVMRMRTCLSGKEEVLSEAEA